MIRNMGSTDRMVRVVVGLAALAASWLFGWGEAASTVLGVGLLAAAALMLVTAAVGYCPTYRLLNISTNPTLHKTSKPEAKVAAHS